MTTDTALPATPSFRLDGRRALVTGAGRGLGLAMAAALAEAGADLADIVKMTFFITDRRDMDELVRVRKARLDGISPAITTVVVSGLVEPEWLVEVEALAHRPRPDAGLPGQLGYTDLGF